MATRAARHIKKDVGPERALKGFQDPKAGFRDRDFYVSVHDFKCDFMAHGLNPNLIGKNIWNPNGRYAWGSLQADRESIRYRSSWKWQAT